MTAIIPVHNRPELLRRALRSVLNQTFKEWEAIVVDDASDDPAANALADFRRDRRIRVLRLDRNGGPSSARNAGLAEARGAFVAFLDSDDEWRPDKLARQLAEAQGGVPRVCVSGATLVAESPGGRILPARAKRPGERIASYLYIGNQFAQASCMFAPTALARDVGFDPRLRQYEDHLFLMRAEAAGAEVRVTRDPLTVQHVDPRPDRLGRRDDAVRAEAFLRAAGDLLLPHEKVAFQLRCQSADAPPGAVGRLAVRALRTRGAPKGAAIKALARSLLGPAVYGRIRTARRRAEGVMRPST